jgi:hypothetical protein
MAAIDMSEQVRQIVGAGVQTRHPHWTPAQIEMAVSAILLGSNINPKGS